MKELPILFSTPMVQAILEGRKTMTRRIMKPQIKTCNHAKLLWSQEGLKIGRAYCSRCGNGMEYSNDFSGIKCRYGQPGDILWVRESWQWIEGFLGSGCYVFKTDERKDVERWRPLIHMPKEAARIWLQVIDVRVERLQDITEEDAIAEGVHPNCAGVEKCPSQYCQRMGCQCTGEYYHYQRDLDDFPAFSAKESFESLWESINGAESWQANPWVWVISFKVLSTNGKPDINS